MKIVVDTNVIVRVLTRDDPHQFTVAARLLEDAEVVILPIVTLCETAWVLGKTAKWPGTEIARAFRLLLGDPKTVFDNALVEQGLVMLEGGGDFADGVIAADGRRFADATFVTFDNQAARLLSARGLDVRLLD